MELRESIAQGDVERFALDFNIRFALAQAANDVLTDGTAAAYSASARKRSARQDGQAEDDATDRESESGGSAAAAAATGMFLDRLFLRHEHISFVDGPSVQGDGTILQGRLEATVPLESNDLIMCTVRIAMDSGLFSKLLSRKSRQFQGASMSLIPASSNAEVADCKALIDGRLAALGEPVDTAPADGATSLNVTLQSSNAGLDESDLIVVIVISILGGVLLVLFCIICWLYGILLLLFCITLWN